MASFPSPSSPIASQHSSRHTAYTDAAPSSVTLADPNFWDLHQLSAENVESDDWLHEQEDGKEEDRVGDGKRGGTVFTKRGVMNVGCLVLLVAALFMLFAGYPILVEVNKHALKTNGAFKYVPHSLSFSLSPCPRRNSSEYLLSSRLTFLSSALLPFPLYSLGGINGTGQVPSIAGSKTFGLIDSDTPLEAHTRTGIEGANKGVSYELVFSDEFETDGRSFNIGDDPYVSLSLLSSPSNMVLRFGPSPSKS
jgi:hypothetical protein